MKHLRSKQIKDLLPSADAKSQASLAGRWSSGCWAAALHSGTWAFLRGILCLQCVLCEQLRPLCTTCVIRDQSAGLVLLQNFSLWLPVFFCIGSPCSFAARWGTTWQVIELCKIEPHELGLNQPARQPSDASQESS